MNDNRFDGLLDKAFERNTNKNILDTEPERFMVRKSAGARVKSRFSGLAFAGVAFAALAIAFGAYYVRDLARIDKSDLTPASTVIINEYEPKHLYSEEQVEGNFVIDKPYCFDFDTAIDNMYVGGVKLEAPYTVNTLSKSFDIYSENKFEDVTYVGFAPKGYDGLAFTIVVSNDGNYRNNKPSQLYVNDDHVITNKNSFSIQGLEIGMNELDIISVWGSRATNVVYRQEKIDLNTNLYAADDFYDDDDYSTQRFILLDYNPSPILLEGNDPIIPHYALKDHMNPIKSIKIVF